MEYKKQVLYAKYYDKPKEFHQAIETFFKNINKKHKKELSQLLTLKFQFFDQQKPLIYPLWSIGLNGEKQKGKAEERHCAISG